MDNDLFMVQIQYVGSIKFYSRYHYSDGSIKYFDSNDPDKFSIIEI